MMLSWYWLIISFILLGAEALGAGGFLLGAAAAALVMFSFTYFFLIHWTWQWVLFGILSLILSIFYQKLFKQINNKIDGDYTSLNNRASWLHGRQFTLEKSLDIGRNKLQFNDTLWTVHTSEFLEKGTVVMVTGSENMTLTIEKHTVSKETE